MIDLSSPVGGPYNLPSLPDVSKHKTSTKESVSEILSELESGERPLVCWIIGCVFVFGSCFYPLEIL